MAHFRFWHVQLYTLNSFFVWPWLVVIIWLECENTITAYTVDLLFSSVVSPRRRECGRARHGTSAAVTFTPSRPCTLTFHFLQLMFSKYCVPDWLWLNRCSATVTTHVTSRLLFSTSPLSSPLRVVSSFADTSFFVTDMTPIALLRDLNAFLACLFKQKV